MRVISAALASSIPAAPIPPALFAVAISLAVFVLAATSQAQTFVNWESPHINPLDLTPDGNRLLAVNTGDNRLEVFSVNGASLGHVASIPVGLEPVSVRARSNDEAWVVNHISDTISVIDLGTLNVRATIRTGDEPTDVVFAGAPQRAFVSISQLNEVRVYDPANLAAAPSVLAIEGEDPRALATDGTTVFVAIFESGNNTSVLGQQTVSSAVNPYPGNANPPPNDGLAFDPPIGTTNPPAVSHIILRSPGGTWEDANGFDWSPAVTWDLHDHDVAMIDATTLGITYRTGLMNLNMHLGLRGSDVVVVGTDATNDLRFEPNLNGVFLRVIGAAFTPGGSDPSIVDLNPHLGTYDAPSVAQPIRDQSLGDPRGVAFNAAGTDGWISGMGSNNVIHVDGALNRLGRVEVGEGPTGVHLNDDASLLYVLNKFEASVSVVDTATASELGRIDFFDPTPAAIVQGRPFLYDTHLTSGLGHTSCGSCHIDGRMDQLAWDLGDPMGDALPLDPALCNGGFGGCEANFHPMKGPMTTQTLVGILNTGPLHWRGDRATFADFNGAFVSLLGDDGELSGPDMDAFEAFVGSLTTVPNPFRNIDSTLVNADLPGLGNPQAGETLFLTGGLDGVNCVTCHAMPTGTNGTLTSGPLLQESQSIKIPQLRNMYEKTGFEFLNTSNNRGFGFIHDGSVDTMVEFLRFPGFSFQNDGQREDVAAFMMSFGTDSHAGVGVQATMGGAGGDQTLLRNEIKAIAESSGQVGLVAKGIVNGEARGYYYLGGDVFQSDRAAETTTQAALDAGTGSGAEVTYTLVPRGALDAILKRIGVDRDGDMFFDGDEADACTDPANPASFPGDGQPSLCACPSDLDGTGDVGFSDILQVIGAWGPCVACPEDIDGSGDVGFSDILAIIGAWGPCG